MVNLRDAFIRVPDRIRPELKILPFSKTPEKTGEIPLLRDRRSYQSEEVARDMRRARKLEVHEKVHHLRQAGYDIQAIARQLKMSRMTVYRYLSMSRFPEHIAREHQKSILPVLADCPGDPFLRYLEHRWQDGGRNASELWREIRTKGFVGSRRQVARWVFERREHPAPTTPTKYLVRGSRSAHPSLRLNKSADQPALPASRRLVWLFLKQADQLDPEDLKLRDELLTHPTLLVTRQLAQDFQRMVREHKAQAFETWLPGQSTRTGESCETAEIPEFANLAAGLRQDYRAVKAALTSKWSNGQTEGQVNKLKLLKRQMYGRANLDLLRLRALYQR